MPAQGTNCFLCKNTWLGPGPICNACNFRIAAYPNTKQIFTPPTNPPVQCNFCGGNHDEADCLAAPLANQYGANNPNQQHTRQHTSYYNNAMRRVAAQFATQKQAQMTKPTRHSPSYAGTATGRRSKPFTNYYSDQAPPMKMCGKCHQRQVVETKAGSICTGCKHLIRNACRCCTSTNTRGLAGDGAQFIECNDCQHIE